MITRHVLAAIDAGVAAGNEDAARAELLRTDWILRGMARRRFERALVDAALATEIHSYDQPSAVRHVLRAAALLVRKQDVPLMDQARVAAAYEAAGEVRPAIRLPIATMVAAVLGLATATTFGAVTVLAIKGPPREVVYERPTPPPPVGVFREGGVPKRDAAIEDVLANEFPKLVAAGASISGPHALDAEARTRRISNLRALPAFKAHGPALDDAWQAMLTTLDAWMVLTAGEPEWKPATIELRARVDVVSDQLAAAELGYYLEPSILADHPRRRAGIFTYRIEQVAFVGANGERIRVLDARRLDRLDAGAAMLGIKAEELDDPVVLLDAVEAKVAHQIMPVLAGRAFPIGDDSWSYSPSGQAAARAASTAIRRELLVALYNDVESAEKSAARCRELLVSSVRHHEAQHRLDQDRGLAHPAVLAAKIGDKKTDPFAMRTRFELSAYISQIASDVWMPQLTLWNLTRHGFRRSPTRSEEALVAVMVIEGLARRLKIPSQGPVLRNGEIDRDRLAQLAIALSGRTTAELRSTAAALWGELYGKPLVRLYD